MRMRNEPIPKLQFSPWYVWEKRTSYGKKYYPGVYLIAITHKNIEGVAPDWNDVVYIGMTNAQGGLASRWRALSNTINGKSGHSGGKTIFADLGHYKEWKKILYVSAMAIECDVSSQKPADYKKMGWVAFLEYDAFAAYAREVGGHPKYNTK